MINAALEKKLVIDSRRNVWVFYSDPSGKVCCSVKRSRGETAAEHLNLNETVEEYDIMMDERDNIHLVADLGTNICAAVNRNGKGMSYTVLWGARVLVQPKDDIGGGSLHSTCMRRIGRSALFLHSGQETNGRAIGIRHTGCSRKGLL